MFPISWTPDPKFTAMVDSRVLFPLDCEAIQVLECFRPLESNTLINWAHEDGNEVEEYLATDIFF